MSRDGKVTENFTDRLQRAAANGTGYLEVQDTARQRRGWVFLEERDVVAVLVDGYQPRLARRLTASELVSVADMGEVLTVARDEYDPRIAVECVARGLVDAVTMKVLYREFMLSAASFVDEWELGKSQWVAGVSPWEGRSTAVSVPLLASAMIRRKQYWAGLWTELSTVTIPDRIPVRVGPVDYRLRTPDEAAVLRAVDGRRTVDQVAGECGFTRFQTGHLMAALMASNVLALFPMSGPRPTLDSLRVQAGYCAASQPIPEPVLGGSVPAGDLYSRALPPERTTPRVSGSLPMAVHVSGPPEGCPGSTRESTHVAATSPVAAGDAEGNVVTEHVEHEDAEGIAGHVPDDSGPVPGERSGGGIDEPQPVVPAEEQVAATDETVTDANREPDDGTAAPHPTEWAQASQPATNLGDFYVSSNPLSAADGDGPPETAAVQQYALPPLPAITGGPSEFYAVLPARLPRRPGGVVGTASTGLPLAMRLAGQEHARWPQTIPLEMVPVETVLDETALDESTGATQQPQFIPEREAAAGSGKDGEMEVTGLRVELLRLATERKDAIEQAAVLREQAILQSAKADSTAALLEEGARSILRLTAATHEASATAASDFAGLQVVRNEEGRIAALRAQIDQDRERVREALVLGQQHFDESSAAHANLERELGVETADQQMALEAWTAATEGAARSVADASQAEAIATECDEQIEKARQRLTEMANAGQ